LRRKEEILSQHTLETLGSVDCRAPGADERRLRPTFWLSNGVLLSKSEPSLQSSSSDSTQLPHIARVAMIGRKSDSRTSASKRYDEAFVYSRQARQGLGTRSAPLRPCRTLKASYVGVCHPTEANKNVCNWSQITPLLIR
jgi:hypothetical protein